ncbi:hypothetical protein E2C01_092903 [Portunus trituberculatus]|uniref:Uncharacterized protein n=1 Tax=Portunus trituberculatus TaxID=210409 RepID=A0A5B7JT55_PORTR|nr:hypothetical protein [Portunus trituberculatus]
MCRSFEPQSRTLQTRLLSLAAHDASPPLRLTASGINATRSCSKADFSVPTLAHNSDNKLSDYESDIDYSNPYGAFDGINVIADPAEEQSRGGHTPEAGRGVDWREGGGRGGSRGRGRRRGDGGGGGGECVGERRGEWGGAEVKTGLEAGSKEGGREGGKEGRTEEGKEGRKDEGKGSKEKSGVEVVWR